MHRCHRCTTDSDPSGIRAITKLKNTISQQFEHRGVEFDIEADCRFFFFFFFFFEKIDGVWGARLVCHWYEKDKILPINPAYYPEVDIKKAKTYPPGCRYLAYFQEIKMGVKILRDMPGHRQHDGTQNLAKHNQLYWQAKDWLDKGTFEFEDDVSL